MDKAIKTTKIIHVRDYGILLVVGGGRSPGIGEYAVTIHKYMAKACKMYDE